MWLCWVLVFPASQAISSCNNVVKVNFFKMYCEVNATLIDAKNNSDFS